MAGPVLTLGSDSVTEPGPRVIVLDADLAATTKVIAAVDGDTAVVRFSDLDRVLDDLDRCPDGVVVLASAASNPAEMLVRLRARRPHLPVVVVSDSRSTYALRALGAYAVIEPDAPGAELGKALAGALTFGTRP